MPYRAKDLPSENTEFGHMDVAITLTCLNFYFSGLTKKQFDSIIEKGITQNTFKFEY